MVGATVAPNVGSATVTVTAARLSIGAARAAGALQGLGGFRRLDVGARRAFSHSRRSARSPPKRSDDDHISCAACDTFDRGNPLMGDD
jgi:hypothetical protein